MDYSDHDIDTFSTAFTADQFTLPDDVLNSPTAAVHHDYPTPTSHKSDTQSAKSPTIQNAPQTNGTTGPKLNPRSCVTCRRRKVRCDKQEPCTNCQKAGCECIFPSPGRAPRRSKKAPDAELLARLRRLEGVVQKLGKNGTEELIEDGMQKTSLNHTNGTGSTSPQATSPRQTTHSSSFMGSAKSPVEKLERFQQFQEIRGRESGRMVIGEGRSRYVSNSFWSGLTEEIAEMRDLLHYSSSEEEPPEGSTPSSTGTNGGKLTHQEFIFGYSSTMMNLRILHPPANQIMTYWALYQSHVDPVVRIFHKPTIEKIFQNAAKDQSNIPKSMEPLVFCVYLAVVTSLQPNECQSILKVDRETALKRYRYAAEQAFSKAGFLTTQEVIVVSAFTLFLTCIRRSVNSGEVWTLTGLLLRMAHSLGLHRDGSEFGLAPYDTEIRRRLWWQVCTLDVRASEDQGSEPMMAERFFDTKLPLNINDADIWPGMTEAPVEREGATEMTFDLVRYEIGNTIRLLSSLSKCPRESKSSEQDQLEAKDAALERLRIKLEDKYLQYCDMTEPLQWLAANVSRLVMAKIWLVIHHPFRRGALGAKIAQETRDRTFLTSIDIVKYARLLETQQKTMRWGWLFSTYRQWHSLAFLLGELCVRTEGPAVEDGWKVVEEAWPAWDTPDISKSLPLWKAIVRLMQRARSVREKILEKRLAFPTDGTLGPVFGNSQTLPDNGNTASMVFPATKFDPSSEMYSNNNSNASVSYNELPDMSAGTTQATKDTSGFDAFGVNSNIPFFPPASTQFPETNLNMNGAPVYDGTLADPLVLNDPLLDPSIDWSNWDMEMGMDIQNEISQPINIDLDQLWGGVQ